MSEQILTATFKPSGFVNVDFASTKNIDYGYELSSNTNTRKYATFTTIRQSGESYRYQSGYYTFDTSSIPDNAKIVSVACSCSLYGSPSAFGTASSAWLEANGSSVSSRVSMGTSWVIRNLRINDGVSFTVKTLRTLRLILRGQVESNNTDDTGYVYFRGATLTVQYQLGPTFSGNIVVDSTAKKWIGGYANIDGVWKDFVKSYENIGSAWKE